MYIPTLLIMGYQYFILACTHAIPPCTVAAPTNSTTVTIVVVILLLFAGGASVPITACIWHRYRKCKEQKTDVDRCAMYPAYVQYRNA